MAFIVEDGSGIDDANAYCDEAFLDAWALSRSYDLSLFDTTAKEAAIVIASNDWIDLYHDFKGYKLSETQGLKMPTNQTVYNDKWRSLVANAAYLQLNGLLLVDESAISQVGLIESEEKSLDGVGSKKLTYENGSSQTYKRKTPSLDAAIKPYLSTNSGSITLQRA